MSKILQRKMSEVLLLMFCSMIFMVLQLTFNSFMHSEFILVYGVSWWSSLTFFAHTSLIFPMPFIEETVFTPLYAYTSFVKY